MVVRNLSSLCIVFIFNVGFQQQNFIIAKNYYYHTSNGNRNFANAPTLTQKLSTQRTLRGGDVTFGGPNNTFPFHAISVQECLHHLRVSELVGLSSAEAANRLNEYGPNVLKAAKKPSAIELFIEQFSERLVQILLGVAILSSILAAFEHDPHAFAEPLVILSILVVNAIVGVWQSKSAENSLEALKKLQPESACVLRDGVWVGNFSTSDIVPGDLVYLRAGDKVPVDGRIVALKTNSFTIDEGSLTGESVAISKTADAVEDTATISGKTSMVFSGTMVNNGGSYVVATSTGQNTEMGRINQGVQSAQSEHMKTPLAIKLDQFGHQLTTVIGLICVGVWVVSIPKFKHPVFGSWLKGAIYHAKIAVALGVAAIPEGLPAVITLCLSLGTRKMAKKNVIVRKLSSIETLGCTSVICTDKTGTLTTNKMTVKSLITFEKMNDPSFSITPSLQKREPLHTAAMEGIVPEDTWPWEDVDNAASTKKIKEKIETSTPKLSNGRKSTLLSLKERAVDGVSYDPIGHVEGISEESSEMKSSTWQLFASVCSICNEANIEYVDGKFEKVGEPTEAALKVLVEKLGIAGYKKNENDFALMAKQCNDFWNSKYDVLSILEFNRDRKSMSVLVRPRPHYFEENTPINQQELYEKQNSSQLSTEQALLRPPPQRSNKVGHFKSSKKQKNILFVKGASEFVTSRCRYIQLEDGEVIPITDQIRKQLIEKLNDMAGRPLRCLALAYKEGKTLGDDLNSITSSDEASRSPSLKDPSKYVEIEQDLTLLGYCGIKDPARPEVAEAITKCREAGIRVMMITGDSKETAIAIAQDVNIFNKLNRTQSTAIEFSNSAFTGKEFFSLPDEVQLDLLRTGNKVFCRAEPQDKQKLIRMLEKLGEIPAMTGDGVNDAPALQQAAIGIAMGITGTEVAKSAADMILADDNFSTIVSAVEEGRNIYANMQTFICFLISCNIGEIATIFFSTLLGIPEPLTPLHLLWVNLVTDGPPATALGFNPSDKNIMKKPPRPRDEQILSQWMMVRYIATGLYVGFATIGVFIWWYLDKGVPLSKLMQWGDCSTWKSFAHSADAPHWPNQPCNIFTDYRNRPQAMSLSTLVTIEMLKALSAVSLDKSLFSIQPWRNPWLLFGVTVPFILHLTLLYVPLFCHTFGLHRLTLSEWKVILSFSLPILIVEELLKFIGRNFNGLQMFSNRAVKELSRSNSTSILFNNPSPKTSLSLFK